MKNRQSALFAPRLASIARALQPAIMLFVAASVIVFVTLGVRLKGELQAFREEPVDNIHWNVTQLELDAVKFETEAEQAAWQLDLPLTELRKRFDLFYSRAQSATKGKMFDLLGLQDVIAPMKLRLQQFMAETTPVIDSDDAVLRSALPKVIKDTEGLREDLRVMSVKIIDKYAQLADQRRASFATLVRQMAWAAAFLLLVLVLMNALILWLNRLAERRAREMAWLSSRLSATVGTSLDAIVVAGRDGRVIDFNSAAEQIFGYSTAEALGSDLANLIVPPNQRENHNRGMERMNRDGTFRVVNSGRFEITAMRKNGEQFPVELSIASHNTKEGPIFISFLRDISERVAANNALRAARDEALAAERTKTNFMAVMSHEMRTPLNGVMAALEIAEGLSDDLKQKRFLHLAQSSAQQLLRHANDVLDISKIEAGKMQLTLEDFDLVGLLRDFVATLGHVAAEKATKIKMEVLSDVPHVRGDAFRIGQIVQNFLSNAIKFSDAGTIAVEVEVQERHGKDLIVEVRVSDSGIGIAEADQERVFDDFVMVDPSYGRVGGGTGLGLAISRRLAHAMGGEIGVESELGLGSCFWLRLPLTVAEPQIEAPVPAPDIPDADPPLNVLVVEDNATNRIVLQELLTNLGHRVTLAEDGGMGMELARATHFDVILMDISMPLMDGLTATALIRMEGKSRSSRIVAVTAHSMPTDRARFRDAGMDDCLTKPISLKDLRAVLRGAGGPMAVQPRAEVAVLDITRLQDLAESLGPATMIRMIDRFRQDMVRILTRLASEGTAQDAARLSALCHEAAGASAMVGATAMHAHFAQAESLCRENAAQEAFELVHGASEGLWRTADKALSDWQKSIA